MSCTRGDSLGETGEVEWFELADVVEVVEVADALRVVSTRTEDDMV